MEPTINESHTSRRRRLSQAEAQAIADAWQASGLSQAAFARQRGIPVKRLHRCLARCGMVDSRRSAAAGAAFVPAQEPQAAVPTDELLWQLPGQLGQVRGRAPALASLLHGLGLGSTA